MIDIKEKIEFLTLVLYSIMEQIVLFGFVMFFALFSIWVISEVSTAAKIIFIIALIFNVVYGVEKSKK